MTETEAYLTVIAEYIWLDGKCKLRSKTKVIKLKLPTTNRNILLEKYHETLLKQLPKWNYDGSSTGQAKGNESEIILNPVRIFLDPFRSRFDLLVMCDTYYPNGNLTESNKRVLANEIFERNLDQEPWYGIEQEYFLIDPLTGKPLGWRHDGSEPEPQGPYYCGIGSNKMFGRNIAEEHLKLCLNAQINISGINAEVAPGQWEYQIGPCTGIDSGDQLWVSRYLLERVAENHNLLVSWDPKPVKGNWNGSGCHTNFSTKQMREGFKEKSGLEIILNALKKLEMNHKEHMLVYGEGNERRMTGEHETANFETFTVGHGDRGASIRIGTETIKNRKGYFEDRRPSSNMDPYLVTSILLETIMLPSTTINTELEANE